MLTSRGYRLHGHSAGGQPQKDGGGYEGLIGNTPMVRLRTLSDATGCDILVKVSLSWPRYRLRYPGQGQSVLAMVWRLRYRINDVQNNEGTGITTCFEAPLWYAAVPCGL